MKQLLERLDSAFFKILDELTIARSRKHITSFYDIAAIGKFPARNKPNSVYPEIDLENRFPSYDNLNKQILKYKLSVFNPSAYVKPEMEEKYKALDTGQVLAFTQKKREYFLIGMIKMNFLKRLESSINSFEISIDRTIRKVEKLEAKINDFIKSKVKSQEESLEGVEPNEDELEENADDLDQWQVGKKLRYDLADLDLEKWRRHLKEDKEDLAPEDKNIAEIHIAKHRNGPTGMVRLFFDKKRASFLQTKTLPRIAVGYQYRYHPLFRHIKDIGFRYDDVFRV